MPAILILGLRSGTDPRRDGRRARRPARHPDDDPAAPRAHRQGTRHPQIPRRHRLRRRAQGRRFRRGPRRSPRRARKREIQRRAGRRAGRVAGRRRRSSSGFGVGLVYKAAYAALRLWKDVPEKIFGAPLKAGSISVEVSPELLGVGYIIGPRIGSIMCAGGVLSYLAAHPDDQVLRRRPDHAARAGHACPSATWRPTTSAAPTSSTSARARWRRAASSASRVRCRRSGTACAPACATCALGRADDARRRIGRCRPAHGPRPADELSWASAWSSSSWASSPRPRLQMNFLGALLIIVFGFLFVTVSSRLTGEIGSSSNPISGMTVATLLFTCLIFLLIGWTGGSALRHGAVGRRDRLHRGVQRRHDLAGFEDGLSARQHAAASSRSPSSSARSRRRWCWGRSCSCSTTTQDRLRARRAGRSRRVDRTEPARRSVARRSSPARRRSRHARNISPGRRPTTPAARPANISSIPPGTRRSGWSIRASTARSRTGPTARTVEKFNAPKAVLVSYIIKGILDRNLPWALVLLGVMIAVVLETVGHPVAGVRGGGVPAAVVVVADLRRRRDPLAGGCAAAAAPALAQHHA